MRRRTLTIALSITAACTGLAAVAVGAGLIPMPPPDPGLTANATQSTVPPPAPSGPPIPNEPVSLAKLPCTNVEQSLGFQNYWAGQSFDGLALTAVLRRCDQVRADEAMRANYVSYVYGDCTTGNDAGCAPPIEVQSWPSVERRKGSLTPGPAESSVSGTDTTVSGVPATKYEDGHRLEIYRPDTTIVVFGDDPARVDRFATALVSGPPVLAELAKYGIIFDATCIVNPNYCTGV